MSMPAALARRRNYVGPALFSYGFRPFFLGAASWAALSVLLWLPLYVGDIALPTAFGALDWHIHEMLYGYVAAVVAGFLLTAVPNWTGQLPINGAPLAALAALWLAGRVAVLASATIGAAAAAVIDVAFLALLAGLMVREIVAGKNWRNLRVIGVVGVLIAGNAVFHAEALLYGRGGIRDAHRHWCRDRPDHAGRRTHRAELHAQLLARGNPGRLPAKFSSFDAATLGSAGLSLVAWVAAPAAAATGLVLLAAGVPHAIRLARWAGDRTHAEPLVLVLHIAYVFVPAGFILLGAAALWPAFVPASAGIHAWTAGAVGMMTLAVMTRATLGHTSHALAASTGTKAIYLCALVPRWRGLARHSPRTSFFFTSRLPPGSRRSAPLRSPTGRCCCERAGLELVP
jgi:uncharacterized protein involved in response to NO